MCKLAGECYVQLQDFDKALQAKQGSCSDFAISLTFWMRLDREVLQAALAFDDRDEDPALYIRLGMREDSKAGCFVV